MPDWTQIAAEYLVSAQQEHNSQTVVYERASDSSTTTILATPLTFKQMEENNGYGDHEPAGVAVLCSGYIFAKDQVAFEPSLGDSITATLNGESLVFYITKLPSGKPWRYFDKYNLQYQVATVL